MVLYCGILHLNFVNGSHRSSDTSHLFIVTVLFMFVLISLSLAFSCFNANGSVSELWHPVCSKYCCGFFLKGYCDNGHLMFVHLVLII